LDKSYLDASRPVDQRVGVLVSRMTLREKIAQTLHAAPSIPRLEGPAYNWWNECLHGVARAGKATVFPQAIGMAATFNGDLVFKIADAISDEARAKHHQAIKQGNRGQYFGLTYWTPNINIFRDPRWGRGQESYGEDPYLTSRMGVAFCRGLQGDDPDYLKLVATPKHYAVHSGPEALRHEFDAVVSPRDLRETYLPAFKACVREAGAYSVMGAYNRTNGEPCCGSKTLLQDILRDEWGFEGYVVSDCWAIADFHQTHKVTRSPAESAAMAVINGCELNCGDMYHNLRQAVDEGFITEAEIDVAVKRLFTARFKLGMFDPDEAVPFSSISPDIVNCEEHVALSLQAARESMVLLKNNGVLPLKKDLAKISVIGPNSMNIDALLANYCGFASNLVTVVEGIVNAASAGTQVFVAKGCDLNSRNPVQEMEIGWGMLEPNDAIVAVVGNTAEVEGEEPDVATSDGGGDRTTIDLPGRQLEMLKLLKKKDPKAPLILVILSGSAVDLAWAVENCDAILYAWYPGEQGGNAVADVLFGDYNPAGRLPVTVVKSMDQLPPFNEYAMKGRTYRFMDEEPLFRFGYGLSYTAFDYSNLKVIGFEPMTVSVDVTNVGRRGGDEVVQLYVKDVEASVPVPLRQLQSFRRIHLDAGETKAVTFELTADQFSALDDDGQPFVEAGTFEISLGGGLPEDKTSGAVSVMVEVE